MLDVGDFWVCYVIMLVRGGGLWCDWVIWYLLLVVCVRMGGI